MPLNYYITVNLRYHFNFVYTTHETRTLCCAQVKVQILEPVNITFLPKTCLNKPMHTGTDFDSIGPVTQEIKIYTNANSLLTQYLLWVVGKIDCNNQK